MTEFEVNEWFRSMDVSDTGFVDEAEYVAGMLNVTRGMTEAEFATSARDTIARTSKKVKHPRYYFHRDDARGYLGEELVPLLEKGLDALLREVESERLRVASGARGLRARCLCWAWSCFALASSRVSRRSRAPDQPSSARGELARGHRSAPRVRGLVAWRSQ